MGIVTTSLGRAFLGSFRTKPRSAFGVPDLLALFLGRAIGSVLFGQKVFRPHVRVHLTSLCNKQVGSEIGFIDLLNLEIHFVMLYIEFVQNAKKLILIIIDLIIIERSVVNIENLVVCICSV